MGGMHRFACVVLIDRHGRLLLQERDEHPVIDPEKWGMCGGHLEPGEDPLTGAVRELEEETGVLLAPGDLTLVEVATVFHAAYDSHDELSLYAAAVDLTDDQRQRLAAAIHASTGKEVEVKVVLDPSVLGGVVTEIGDDIIDGSVRRRLNQLRESFR